MATTVRIGPNEALAVEVISDTVLEATYAGGGEGPEDVEVTTSAGSVVASGAFVAIPNPRPPTIAAVEPATGRGGQRVTIRGTGFEA
jgi:hypothetical protein